MSTKIYVGNLPWRTTEAQLSELFVPYGEVVSVRIVSDRDTGRSRGFAFVTIATAEGAKAAIAALNGSLLGGRALVVNEANDQGNRPPGGAGPRRSGPRPVPGGEH
ncbi:MAG: RNA-binding protein [Lautropia sp.]|nr:RNA-binding protein [Lautropia sp.]